MFGQPEEKSKNLLPQDGETYIYKSFYSLDQSLNFFKEFQKNITWSQKQIKIFGKMVLEPRLSQWQGDKGLSYKYSGQTLRAEAWDVNVKAILSQIQNQTKYKFNSCLLNYYRDGQDSMGWHRDNEPELGVDPTIASVSFGESRIFKMRHRLSKDLKLNINLEPGDLLIMTGSSQNHWEHSVAKTKRAIGGRINLTYRWIGQD